MGSINNKCAINICIYGSNVLKELALLPTRPRTARSNSTVPNFLRVLSYHIISQNPTIPSANTHSPNSSKSHSVLQPFLPTTLLFYLPGTWFFRFPVHVSCAHLFSYVLLHLFSVTYISTHIPNSSKVLVHAVGAYRGNRDIAPLVLNLGTRWRKQLIARPGRLSALNHWAGWTPSAVWTASRTEKSLSPTGNQTKFLGCPVV